MSDDHDDTRDQPQAQAAEPPTPERWGDPIPDARKAELRGLFERQAQWAAQPEAERGDSQFKGVPLSGADVFWLTVLALAGEEGDTAATEARFRAVLDLDRNAALDLSALRLEGGIPPRGAPGESHP